MDECIQKIIAEIHKKKYLIIGELHGVQENIHFLQKLLPQCGGVGPTVLAFEWPLSNEESQVLSAFVMGASKETSKDVRKVIDVLRRQQSGVFSDQHLAFLQWLRDYNADHKDEQEKIHIACFDSEVNEGKEWSDRDRSMAECIQEIGKKFENVIVVVGDMHARTKPFRIFDGEHPRNPMATHFSNDDRFSIWLRCGSGQFYNFGVKDVDEDVEPDALSQYYDYVCLIPKGTPVTNSS